MKKRLALVGAHPDDCDILGSGLAMRYRELDWQVLFVAMANGDAGHHDMTRPELAARRRKETEAVAAMLGIEYVVMPTHDCEVLPSLEQRWALLRLLRRFAPDPQRGQLPRSVPVRCRCRDGVGGLSFRGVSSVVFVVATSRSRRP